MRGTLSTPPAKRRRVRISGGVSIVAIAAAVSLIASSCSSNPGASPQREAGGPEVGQIAALPSESPANTDLAGGGGGPSGGEWTIYGMPGADGGTDKGFPAAAVQQSISGGVSTKFTALVGAGPYQWVVRDATDPQALTKPPLWDSQVVVGVTSAGSKKKRKAPTAGATSTNCTMTQAEASCTIPAGILSVGGSYTVATTTSTGIAAAQTETRMFSVVDQPAVSGSADAQIAPQNIKTGNGEFGLGLHYNTAVMGATANTAAKSGFTNGLPGGWTWSGLPGGLASIQVVAGVYQGFDTTIVMKMAGATTLLGCTKSATIGERCTEMTGPVAGAGYAAQIPNDGGPITITDQQSQANWQFDPGGRLTAYNQAGQYPLLLSYRANTNLFDTLKFGNLEWDFYYADDKQCDDSSLPAGFVKTPNGYLCSFNSPAREWQRVLYTQPLGATVPRISRLLKAPDNCQWNFANCKPTDVELTDIGWDSFNRPMAQRNELNTWGLSQGSLTAGYDASQTPTTDQVAKDPTLTTINYDATGRIAKAITPAANYAADGSKAARIVATRTYYEGDQVASKFGTTYAPATRVIQMDQNTLDGSAQGSTSLKAYDDANRGIYSVGPDGLLTTLVWNPIIMNQTLATVTASYVQSTTFDAFGRQLSQYSGPSSAFNLSTCSPTADFAHLITSTVCTPTDPSSAVQQTLTYDQIQGQTTGGVQPLLTAEWFNNPDYSGNPDSIAGASWQAAGNGLAAGFPLNPPSSVGNDYGLRLSGGLAVPKGDWSVTVSVPDPDLKGTLTIAGRAPCVIANKTTNGCTFNNSSGTLVTTNAVPLVLNLSRDSSNKVVTGVISLVFSDNNSDSGDPRLSFKTNNFGDRYSAVTAVTTTDPLPVSSAKAMGTALKRGGGKGKKASNALASFGQTYYTYGDIQSESPTQIGGSGSSATTGQPATAPPTSSQFENDGLSGTRLRAESPAGGGPGYTYTYWGDSETPKSSAFSNLSELPSRSDSQPSDVAGQAQYGQVKTIQDPTGRRMDLIYDEYGAIACRRQSLSDDDPNAHWLCFERDDAYRLLARTTNGGEGDPTINVSYATVWGTSPGAPVSTSTATTITQQDGKQTDKQTEVSVVGSASQTLKYTDALGTLTDFVYDAFGRTTSATVTPAPTGSTAYVPNRTDYTYNSSSAVTDVAINGTAVAKITYKDSNAAVGQNGVSRVVYFPGQSNQFQLDVSYSQVGGIAKSVWTTPDGTLTDMQQTSTGGQVVSASFGDVDMKFQYDGRQRLTWAEIGGNDFTYGWDDTENRICAAPQIPNPAGAKNCADLAQKTTYAYENTTPIATSDPLAQIPTDKSAAFTRYGNLKQVGTTAMTYDANGALSSATNSNGEFEKFRRDLAGRVIEDSFSLPVPPPNPPSGVVSSQVAPPVDAPKTQATPQTQAPTADPSKTQATPESQATPADPSKTQATPESQATPGSPASEPTQGVQRRAGSDEAPTQSTSKYGYSGSGGGATVAYTEDGPVALYQLPGGVQLAGTRAIIASSTGFASLALDATTGKINGATPDIVGPFSEAIAIVPIVQGDTTATLPVNTLVDQGARTFNRNLGLMLQPDPSMLPGQSLYNGVGTDPVNFGDPTGLSREGKGSGGHANVMLGATIAIFGTALGYMGANYLQRTYINKQSWFKNASPEAQKAVLFLFYFAVDMAVNVGVALIADKGNLKKTWGVTWDIDATLATISSYAGAYLGQPINAVSDIIESVTAKVESATTSVTDAIKEMKAGATALYEKPMQIAKDGVSTAISFGKGYLASELPAMVAYYATGGNNLAYWGVKGLATLAYAAYDRGILGSVEHVKSFAGSAKTYLSSWWNPEKAGVMNGGPLNGQADADGQLKKAIRFVPPAGPVPIINGFQWNAEQGVYLGVKPSANYLKIVGKNGITNKVLVTDKNVKPIDYTPGEN